MYSKDLSPSAHADVLVAGGGPAGCAAAAAAAREGKSVLLLEAAGCLGGMGTAGLVPTWCPFSDKEKMIYRGLAKRVFEESKIALPHVMKRENWLDWVPIDAEHLKRVYDSMMEEFGVTVLLHTLIVDVLLESGRITGVVAAGKSGLALYTADMFVDCTGDADIAAAAGAPYQKGDETGAMQPATLCFTLTNVNEYAYLNGPELHPSNPDSPIYKILRDGKYPILSDAHLCHALVGPRTVGFNAGHLFHVDNNDVKSLTHAQQEGRKIAKAFRDALAEYVPAAFAGAHLVKTASMVGIRETRRIVGLYTLTREDYINRRSFEGEICRNAYYLDVHQPKGLNDVRESEKHTYRYGPGESHGIPYRCLIPQNTKNVLVAGRCLSCDRQVQGSVRVMPVCLATGEAAGAAAALALSMKNGQPDEVDDASLRRLLKHHGAYFQ